MTPHPTLPAYVDRSPAGSILRGLAWLLVACAVVALGLGAQAGTAASERGAGDIVVGTVFAYLAVWCIPCGLGAALAFALALMADSIHSSARHTIQQTQLLREILEAQRPAAAPKAAPCAPITIAQIEAAEAAIRRAKSA